jgi:hypothetical protein
MTVIAMSRREIDQMQVLHNALARHITRPGRSAT